MSMDLSDEEVGELLCDRVRTLAGSVATAFFSQLLPMPVAHTLPRSRLEHRLEHEHTDFREAWRALPQSITLGG